MCNNVIINNTNQSKFNNNNYIKKRNKFWNVNDDKKYK